MELYRFIEEDLLKWKNRSDRRPLILEGARQVGKSWVMRHFGAANYPKVAYFNFENSPELCKEFMITKSPLRLIDILSLYCGFSITPEDTLIIFDEIQECNEALNSLKYFYEETPLYHIMAAGSLLGVAMGKDKSFPVGKVDFLKMYPLTFKEFLYSADKSTYSYINNLQRLSPLPEIVFNRLREEYRRFLIAGGMPKAAVTMIAENDLAKVDFVLNDILRSFILDFGKHAPKADIPRITEIWNSLPSQLAKENRKFVYKLVRPGARAREYENALLWLQLAGLIYKVNCNTQPAIPLMAYDDVSAFKIYVFDIGILRVMSHLSPAVFFEDSPLFREFKGAYFENAILQALVPQFATMPRYWISSGKAEIDFLLHRDLSIVPVEVKADTNTAGKSLKVYIDRFNPPFSLIISGLNAYSDDHVFHLPHGLADWISSLFKF